MTETIEETKGDVTTDKWYAWSNIDFGATRDKETPSLLVSRKILNVGSIVTPDSINLEADSDEWKELIDSGVIRSYPLPDELMDTNTSPQKIVSAKLQALADGVDTGILDQDVVMGLMEKKKYPLEGQHEVSPEGKITPAAGPSPQATTPSTSINS